MCLCEKCAKMAGTLIFILGIIFLLQDLNVWNFWNISWYTSGFIIGGIIMFFSTVCPECKLLRK